MPSECVTLNLPFLTADRERPERLMRRQDDVVKDLPGSDDLMDAVVAELRAR